MSRIVLDRHDWKTGGRKQVAVDPKTVQEIIDTIFHTGFSMRLESNPEWFARQLRLWEARLEAPPAPALASQPKPTVGPKAKARAPRRPVAVG